jgi:hypothetical protein
MKNNDTKEKIIISQKNDANHRCAEIINIIEKIINFINLGKNIPKSKNENHDKGK